MPVRASGDGVVGFPCIGHGFRLGRKIVIAGTYNYDGTHYVLQSSTGDQIQIRADCTAEKMKADSMIMHEMDEPAFMKYSNFNQDLT